MSTHVRPLLSRLRAAWLDWRIASARRHLAHVLNRVEADWHESKFYKTNLDRMCQVRSELNLN